MTLSVDNVKPSSTPDSWDLPEIFAYAIAYGTWLALSTIALLAIIVDTSFFSDKFGVTDYVEANDRHVKMIIYLQVAMIRCVLYPLTLETSLKEGLQSSAHLHHSCTRLVLP